MIFKKLRNEVTSSNSFIEKNPTHPATPLLFYEISFLYKQVIYPLSILTFYTSAHKSAFTLLPDLLHNFHRSDYCFVPQCSILCLPNMIYQGCYYCSDKSSADLPCGFPCQSPPYSLQVSSFENRHRCSGLHPHNLCKSISCQQPPMHSLPAYKTVFWHVHCIPCISPPWPFHFLTTISGQFELYVPHLFPAQPVANCHYTLHDLLRQQENC